MRMLDCKCWVAAGCTVMSSVTPALCYGRTPQVDTKAKGACTCNGFAPNLTAPAAQVGSVC